MARRGDLLREHILYVAKDVFLEMGFERTSMDVIASRAETSKRTLYAHFESKENLFLAVIELVRGLFLNKLKTPSDYPGEPTEALTLFCGRFLEALLYERTIRMCRLCISEADRFPEGAARYFDVVFSLAQERLEAYLKETLRLSHDASSEAAERLLGQIIFPRFSRALFGMDTLSERLEDEGIRADFDVGPVGRMVEELVGSLSASHYVHIVCNPR
ncbi:TetR/AcrR family transcriptional regulator [soil metagenome]